MYRTVETNYWQTRSTARPLRDSWATCFYRIIIIIIIIKNKCHSNIIVDRLQGYGHSKKLREGESERWKSSF